MWYNKWVSNGEDILAAGQTREPEQEKRIRTMQQDLERASEHALPDLPIPTPDEQAVPSFSPAPEPESLVPPPPPTLPAPPPPPVTRIAPPAPSPGPQEAPAGLPVVPEEEIDLLGELEIEPAHTKPAPPPPPAMPTTPPAPLPPAFPEPAQKFEPQEPPVLTPEERLSFGEEKREGLVETPPPPIASPGEGGPVLRPEELLSFGEEALPQARRTPFSGLLERFPIKFLALGAGLVAAVAAAGIVYIVVFRGAEKPAAPLTTPGTVPPTTIGPQCPPITIPDPLLAVADSRQFSVANLDELGNEIKRALASDIPAASIVRMVMKLEAVADCRLVSFEEVLAGFNIILPKNVADSVDSSRFTVFLWRQEGGMRVGFAVGVKDIETMRGDLLAWEPNMTADLNTFLKQLGKITDSATPTFQDNVRRSVPIRYLNFPLPDLTIDYATDQSRNLFLFTTSRESMFTAIDALP